MKHYDCVVPGCNWHTEANDTAEIVRRAVEHLHTTHDETDVRPQMVEHIKERVVEAASAN